MLNATTTFSTPPITPPPHYNTCSETLILPHRLNEDNLCLTEPIPIHAIPIETLQNFPVQTRLTTINSHFEVWNPPKIVEDIDYMSKAPASCEAPYCYMPKAGDRRPVGMIKCHHPDVVDEFIKYYVCKRCFSLKHRFCGMDIMEHQVFKEPWPKVEETEWKTEDQTTKPWGSCWDKNPWEMDWWKDATEWVKWKEK
uniref:Uncharacterized protein n=1 Tax=Moniliophthora roreri TaxID=221103 RepID=A0A0W0FG91_MONRR